MTIRAVSTRVLIVFVMSLLFEVNKMFFLSLRVYCSLVIRCDGQFVIDTGIMFVVSGDACPIECSAIPEQGVDAVEVF